MNDIIFWSGIWSPYYHDCTRPIGCYQLAHWLRKHKFNCQVVEFVHLMSVEELLELTELAISKNTFAIGLSTTFWPPNGVVPNNISIVVSYLKKKYPRLEIIGGGPRINRYQKFFDRIFTNDAENTLLTYCQQKKYSITFPTSQFDIVNSDHRFIEQIWGKTLLGDHLNDKWKGILSRSKESGDTIVCDPTAKPTPEK
jgi:hypothetical protein